MTLSGFTAVGSPRGEAAAEYIPGVCNIGPDEIARRRRAGHVGVLVTIVAFVALVAVGAPPLVRFVVALPAAGAASGYLQAWLRFCAGFGSLGVFNLGPHGTTQPVEDAAARSRDRARSVQIGVASGLVGVAVGIVAVLLPV